MNDTQILQKLKELEDKISDLTSEVDYLKMLLNVETFSIKTNEFKRNYTRSITLNLGLYTHV